MANFIFVPADLKAIKAFEPVKKVEGVVVYIHQRALFRIAGSHQPAVKGPDISTARA